MQPDIPDFLRKRGITRVTDNLQPGQTLQAPARLFFTLFREELVNACTRPSTTGDGHAPATAGPAGDE